MEVYIKEPGKKPQLKNIPNTLEALQEIVGGYIETVTFGDTIVICNEEGRLKGLPENCKVYGCGKESFVGTIAFVGKDGDEFTDFNLFGNELYTDENGVLHIVWKTVCQSLRYRIDINDQGDFVYYDYDVHITEDDLRAYLKVDDSDTAQRQLTKVFKAYFDIDHFTESLLDDDDFVDWLYDRYYEKAEKEYFEDQQ